MEGESDESTGRLALGVINDAMVAYASNPVARALTAAIPFGIGSFVDTFFGTAGSNLILDRMQALGEEVRDAVHRVDAAKQDPAVTEQQLFDAAIRAVRGAMETGSREKVQLIAAILVGATAVDRPAELDVESVMASMVSLTPADLRSARRLADHLGPGIFPPPAELGPDGLFFIARLQAAGLLESVVLPASPPGSRAGPGFRSDPGVEYRFTPTFGRILALLRAGGVDITG